MTYNVKIAPSLLAADFTRLGDQVREVVDAGVELLHIDVMDGHFVPNLTMGPFIVEAVRRVTDIPLDVHLMITNPDHYIHAFANAGASSISVHYEVCPNLYRTMQVIRDAGCKVGVAINPHTSANALVEVFSAIDVVNVMTVNPGFGGQSFIPNMMPKIAQLRALLGDRKHPMDIEVDGGINLETMLAAVESGANVLIIGTAIFGYDRGITAGIKAVRAALTDAFNE